MCVRSFACVCRQLSAAAGVWAWLCMGVRVCMCLHSLLDSIRCARDNLVAPHVHVPACVFACAHGRVVSSGVSVYVCVHVCVIVCDSG